MSQAFGSKEAARVLIDPMNEPEPAAETGLNTHFGSTFAPAKQTSPTDPRTHNGAPTASASNAYRKSSTTLPSKGAASSSARATSGSPRGHNYSSSEAFPKYRAEAFGDYEPVRRERAASHGHHSPPSYKQATSPVSGSSANADHSGRPRRGSSLSQRFPGDKSNEPLTMLRRDSRKAYRSPHLHKRSLQGPDSIDKLDPAIGGLAYHHEGPYDAASMARNRDPKRAPVEALRTSNREALKATPSENIKDAVEGHKPLDGVAFVPPGLPDRMGRTYNYEEGDDLMHEASSGDPGYKRWPGKDYDRDDLKGESEPTFSLDRALQAHKIDDNGIEMEDRSHLMQDYREGARRGTLDTRDPVAIAGDDRKYADLQHANGSSHDSERPSSGGLSGLKKRIGSLRHRKDRDD